MRSIITFKQKKVAIIKFTPEPAKFTWLVITNPSPDELLGISRQYDLHEYTLRDCLEPDHLPKHEYVGKTNFIITRLLTGETNQTADSIQEMTNKVALFYNDKILITVHVRPQEFLPELKDKFVTTGECTSTTDIVVKIIWSVLNSYDKPAIRLINQVDSLETQVFFKQVSKAILEDLYYIKRKATVSHKLLTLTTDAINSIRSDDEGALQDLKDLHVRLLHTYGQVYEDVTNLLNVYLSISSQKTNEVVKVLTIFSVFFMPLTFIAGIYGMNFQFMPELNKKWGYPAAILLMIVTSGVIYFWFKKKKWL